MKPMPTNSEQVWTVEQVEELLGQLITLREAATKGEWKTEYHDARGDDVRVCLVGRSEEFLLGYYVIASDDAPMRRQQAIADFMFIKSLAAAPEIIRFLLDSLTRARQDAEQMKEGIGEAIRLIHTADDYDAGMRLLCKLIGREDKWPKDMKRITVHEVAARAARDKEKAERG